MKSSKLITLGSIGFTLVAVSLFTVQDSISNEVISTTHKPLILK